MKRKIEGHYDYFGACAPWSTGGLLHHETFSVSVFMWVRSKTGLKKSKSVYRIYGYVNNPEAVYKRAEEICDLLDKGLIGTLTRKSERVRNV